MSLRSQHFLNLFRALVPSWRFFDEVHSVPELRFRVHNRLDGFGDWQIAWPAQAHALVLNPQVNLRHAAHSLLESLVSDLKALGPQAEQQASELVSYQLVKLLARRLVLRFEPQAVRFQFSVVRLEVGQESELEEILCSPEYEV